MRKSSNPYKIRELTYVFECDFVIDEVIVDNTEEATLDAITDFLEHHAIQCDCLGKTVEVKLGGYTVATIKIPKPEVNIECHNIVDFDLEYDFFD